MAQGTSRGTPAAVWATTLCSCHARLLHCDHWSHQYRPAPHTGGCPQIPAAPMPSPEHPKLCLRHHSGAQGRQKCVPGPAPAAGREPMGPVFGQKDGNRHPERGAQPPFSPTPTPAWAWAARSLQLLGRPSNRRPGLGRSPQPPRLQPHHRGQRGTVGSSSAQRVKHGSRTGSITSARLRF